jgi:hypothetical protein
MSRVSDKENAVFGTRKQCVKKDTVYVKNTGLTITPTPPSPIEGEGYRKWE